MGRRRRQGNSIPQKDNSIKDLVVNEENKYQIPEPKRIMINIPNELSDIHRKSLKEEFMDKIIEKLMEKL
jgi:hypothetical protein